MTYELKTKVQWWESLAISIYAVAALGYFVTTHPHDDIPKKQLIGYTVICNGFEGVAVSATSSLVVVERKPLIPKVFKQQSCERKKHEQISG